MKSTRQIPSKRFIYNFMQIISRLVILKKQSWLKLSSAIIIVLLGSTMTMGQSLPTGPNWKKSPSTPENSSLPQQEVIAPPIYPASISLLDVRNYGSGLNYATLTAALTAIGSKSATLFIAAGVWKIDNDIIFPANLTLKFERGAIFVISHNVKVVINCEIDAGPYQIFGGNGMVTGNIIAPYIYPQWWGAKGDGVADDYQAISKAVTAATGGRLFFQRGTYLTSQAIVLPDHIFVDAEPGTTIKASTPMTYLLKVDVPTPPQFPRYDTQQLSIKNLILNGNRLAQNCIYLYKISMNNFPAIEGLRITKSLSDGAVFAACQGGAFREIKSYENGRHGIAILGCDAATFHSINSNNNKGSGIFISRFTDINNGVYGGGCKITGVDSESNGAHGIEIDQVINNTRVSIIGGHLESNAIDGINIRSSPVSIFGLSIIDNKKEENYAVHVVSGSQVYVNGCTIVKSKGVATTQFKDEGNSPDNIFAINYDGIAGCFNKEAMLRSVIPPSLGPELLINGNMEETGGWNSADGIITFQSSNRKKQGNYSVKFQPGFTGGQVYQNIAYEAGVLYLVEGWLFATASTQLRLRVNDGVSQNIFDNNIYETTKWTKVSRYFIAKGSNGYIALNTSETSPFYMDNFTLKKVIIPKKRAILQYGNGNWLYMDDFCGAIMNP
jgi:hypothetical protein